MSIEFAPSEAYIQEFTTLDGTGLSVDADETPTVEVSRNGTLDGTFAAALTVGTVGTGHYKVTGFVPAGYVSGDRFTVIVSGVITAISTKAPLQGCTVRDENVDTLPPAPSAEEVRIEMDANSTKLDVAVSTRSDFDETLDTVARVTLVDTTTDVTNGGGATAEEVRIEMDTNSTKLDVATSTRSDFDHTSDTIANVTLVDTTTTNTDMRGTDSASTFNPVSDTVAHVTLVDTTTTNADMRGTDGASTFDHTSDPVANVTLVDTTTTNTDMITPTDILDAEVEDNGSGTTWSLKQVMRLMFAPFCGERSGGGIAGDKTFKVPGGTKSRVIVTTDKDGNTTAPVTLDDTDA